MQGPSSFVAFQLGIHVSLLRHLQMGEGYSVAAEKERKLTTFADKCCMLNCILRKVLVIGVSRSTKRMVDKSSDAH